MKPYYQRQNVTLYHGDCLEWLPTLEAGSVDAVVTDPPYGINYVQGGGKGVAGRSRFVGEKVTGDRGEFDPRELFRFRNAILWGANYFRRHLPLNGSFLIWDKRCGVTPSRDQADCEIAWCSSGSASRVFRFLWDGMLRDGDDVRVHPTQKPVAVMEWSLGWLPDGCDVIADPYFGSGTTAIACLRQGKSFIGCELEEKYCEIAARRIDRELDQGRLFDKPEPQPVQKSLIGDAQ